MSLRSALAVIPLAFLLASQACSGIGVTSDCQRICDKVTSCYGDPSLSNQCATMCRSAAGGSDAGAAAEAAVRACADCIGTQSCSSVAVGACNSACPKLDYFSSSTTPPADTCQHAFPLEGGDGQIVCDAESDGYYCSCYADSIKGRTFTSLDFCHATAASRDAQARKGCHW